MVTKRIDGITKKQLHAKTQRIEDLLKAANDAGSAARNAWLGFLAVIAYILITIASTTHEQLLRNAPVKLPILEVNLPLVGFYFYAPILLLLIHLGLLVQHAVTARILHALNEELRRLGENARQKVRERLNHYMFCQSIAGQYRLEANEDSQDRWLRLMNVFGSASGAVPRMQRLLMSLMLWVSFVVLPLITFLYFQINFLPYHHKTITWWHRLWIGLDLFLLWSLWPIIAWNKPSWRASAREYSGPFKFIICTVSAAIVLFSLLVATVPDRWIEENIIALFPRFLLDDRRDGNGKILDDRKILVFTAKWFEGQPDDRTLEVRSFFARNLFVARTNLVDDDYKWDRGERSEKIWYAGEWSLDLRGRNLAYGIFYRSDLSRADMAYANLTGANFYRAKLQRVRLTGAKLDGTNFLRTDLSYSDLNRLPVTERPTNFVRAILKFVDFDSAKLRNAVFVRAILIGADLRNADLRGAVFYKSILNFANLNKKTKTQGALFVEAHLIGTHIVFAKDQDSHIVLFAGAVLADAVIEGLLVVDENKHKHKKYEMFFIDSKFDTSYSCTLFSPSGKKNFESGSWPAVKFSMDLRSRWKEISAPNEKPRVFLEMTERIKKSKQLALNGWYCSDNSARYQLAERIESKLDDETRSKLCNLILWRDVKIENTVCGPWVMN